RVKAAAEETLAIIKGEGHQASAHVADVTKSADIKALVEACLKAYGRIDILHNNVGIASLGGPVELSEADWDKVNDVNIKSFFLTCKHVLPVMEKQGKGAIINVSSIASIRMPKGIHYVAYNATKGAVNSFTQAVALQ